MRKKNLRYLYGENQKIMKIVKPRIPSILTEHSELSRMISEFRFEQEEFLFKDQIVSEYTKSGLVFSSCIFDKCNFSEGSFSAGKYCDVIFRNCDFSTTNLSECNFNRVEFIDCRLTGVNWSSSRFSHVLWNNCQARYSIWSQSTFLHASFSGCDLQSVAMDDCKWEGLRFDFSDLKEAEFYNTLLKNINFTTCVIDHIRVNGPELGGAVVTSLQLIGLARILGVIVEG